MKITWFNNASILIEEGGEKLLIDPFVPFDGAENPGSVDTYLRTGAKHILITHGHLDHLLNVPEIAARTDVQVFCTGTPEKTLRKYGVAGAHITQIRPGTRLLLSGFEVDVKQGRHVRFDPPLVFRTLFSRRMLRYREGRRRVLRHHRHFPEHGETVVFEIRGDSAFVQGSDLRMLGGGVWVQVLGSMALDARESYRQHADCLVLPYQGHSDMAGTALGIVEKLLPRKILLDHFDDAFPPVSGCGIDPAPFIAAMARRYPGVEVIVPQAGVPVEI
jgi:L-ascorbate metabolism protein UlaG (beta-lactamase superfamily)